MRIVGLGGVALDLVNGGRPRDGIVAGTLGASNVQDHIHCLLYLDNLFAARGIDDGPHVDGHGLESGIEELVAVQQAGDASLALARKQLEEGCEVLGAHDLVRQYPVEEMQVRCTGMVAFGVEGYDRPDRLGLVDEVEGGAEEAGEIVDQRQPSREGLVLAIGLDPRPELHAVAALSCAVPRPLPPVLGVPAPHTESQMQLLGVCMLQDLTQ